MVSHVSSSFMNSPTIWSPDFLSDYAFQAELLETIKNFRLEIEKDESVKKIVDWCAEKFETDEYRIRVLAAKKIINCYALNGSELCLANSHLYPLNRAEQSLSNGWLTSLPELNLSHLERLDLRRNPQLQDLPSSLANSSLLVRIDIAETQIPQNRVDEILAACRERKSTEA